MFEIGDTVRVISNGKRLALALIVGIATLTAGQGIDYSEHGTMTVDVSKADDSLRYVSFHEPTDPQISYTAICQRTHADCRKLDAGKDYDFQILPPTDPNAYKRQQPSALGEVQRPHQRDGQGSGDQHGLCGSRPGEKMTCREWRVTDEQLRSRNK